jgi:uncharacterized protein YndB with AHSA1/START domain
MRDTKAKPAYPTNLILNRRVQAPRDWVFGALTQAEHLVRWWAPKGFTMPVCQVDLRPGGAWNYTFRSKEGWEHACNALYLEVEPPQKLVMESSVPGKDGQPLFKIRQIFTLEEKKDATILHVEVEVLEAHPGSEPYLNGMKEGFSQTLDNLVGYLGK